MYVHIWYVHTYTPAVVNQEYLGKQKPLHGKNLIERVRCFQKCWKAGKMRIRKADPVSFDEIG